MVFQCPRDRRKACYPFIWVHSSRILTSLLGKKRQSGGENLQTEQPAKKTKKPKQYVPAFRSGPYALMLGLATLEEGTSQALTKAQLIEVAQEHCDSSFTAPSDAGKFYTAWNSMKTLVQKDLVYEHGRPQRKYALTEEGWEIVNKVKKTVTGMSDNVPLVATTNQVCKRQLYQKERIFKYSGTY